MSSGIAEEIICLDCKRTLPLQVCRSNAGAYIGYWCPKCGPYSRESGYFKSSELAEKELAEILKSNQKKEN